LNDDGSLASEKLHYEQIDNWDGVVTRQDAHQEGSNNMGQAERKAASVQAEVETVDREAAEGALPSVEDLEVEPPLTREQYVYGQSAMPLLTC
jgi:hypothetical protein